MEVGIIGNGPAGNLAAHLFRHYSHHVTQWGTTKARPQNAHIHVCDPRIDIILGDLFLKGPDHNYRDWHFIRINENGLSRTDWRGPRRNRHDYTKLIPSRSSTLNFYDHSTETSGFDILIDATGCERRVLNQFDKQALHLTVMDCQHQDIYRTWTGRTELSRPTLIQHKGKASYYLEISSYQWKLTLIENAYERLMDLRDVIDILKSWNIEFGSSSKKPIKILGPSARRVFAAECVPLALPVCPFGDALVQTSPSLGFGILSVFQQALILKAWLESASTVSDLASALDSYADQIWYEAALMNFGK